MTRFPVDLRMPSYRYLLRRTGSTKQALSIAFVIGLCLVAATWVIARREKAQGENARKWAMEHFGLLSETSNSLGREYQDADQDLIADTPADEGQWIKPEVLKFSYVASEGPEGQAEAWQRLMDAIESTTGITVAFQPANTTDEQLAALKSGELHITGLNTGSVPRAVNVCGFVPVCTFAGKEDEVGVRSVIIVPNDSNVKSIADLKGKIVTFTNTSSNSGFKAPLALLSDEYGMNPDIDYEYSFAGSHDKAISLIATKEAMAAAVASDLLDRAVKSNVISADQFRIIYESERFPPAAIGYAHNLAPETAAQIREALVAFEIDSGPLSELFSHLSGGTRIVPVSYKDDWALIRRIDNSLGVVHALDTTSTREET